MKLRLLLFMIASMFCLSLLLLPAPRLFAASIANIQKEITGETVTVTYDLIGDEGEDEAETVLVTITIDGRGFTPLELKVRGDYGNVKPGKGKRLTWRYVDDYAYLSAKNSVWDLRLGGKDFTEDATGTRMIFVEGGCFMMGDWTGRGKEDERPRHNVCLDDYYIAATELTQAEWTALRGKDNNPSKYTGCPDCPVEQVDWRAASRFLERLEKATGRAYRLPTEAEWEYAARARGQDRIWSGTSDEAELWRYAWHWENGRRQTHPAAQADPNGTGLFDMSGNVWEWVSDHYDSTYYANSPVNNPRGPESGAYRVVRGGSWKNIPWYLRTTLRLRRPPDFENDDQGFRPALSAKP